MKTPYFLDDDKLKLADMLIELMETRVGHTEDPFLGPEHFTIYEAGHPDSRYFEDKMHLIGIEYIKRRKTL
jgi:hypothetical protein